MIDKQKLKKMFGIALIVLGIIGLFLPILQGILFIVLGLMLLGFKKKDINKWIKKAKERILDLME